MNGTLELGQRVGSGGFGTVYRQHHKLLDMDFAVKVFEPVFVSKDENIDGERRFFREAKMLFRLNNEQIVRIYDVGRIDEKPFIRMEFLDGYTLQSCFLGKREPYKVNENGRKYSWGGIYRPYSTSC